MTTIPNTLKFVKNTPLRIVFSTDFSVFGNVVKHDLSCLIYTTSSLTRTPSKLFKTCSTLFTKLESVVFEFLSVAFHNNLWYFNAIMWFIMYSGQEMRLKVSSLFLWRMLTNFSGQLWLNLASSIWFVISWYVKTVDHVTYRFWAAYDGILTN